MLSSTFLSYLEERLAEVTGRETPVRGSQSVGGGSINEAFRLKTDQGSFFLKVNDAQAYPGMFEAEAKGLELLRGKSGLRIPQALLHGEFERQSFLIMEFLDAAPPSPTFWQDFGTELARLHRNDGASHRASETRDEHSNKKKNIPPAFGLDHHNYIGSLPQDNTPCDSWSEFFITRRLEPMIRMGNTDREVNRGFDRLFMRLDDIFPHEPPALLHGDLWSGNYGRDEKGMPAIFDPAVYFGHREMDIAMSRLFGGFDGAFYEAYRESYPLEKGWEKRIDIANLYPLLVHVNLFGGSYLNSVRGILKPFR